jgi:hypothetical protein
MQKILKRILKIIVSKTATLFSFSPFVISLIIVSPKIKIEKIKSTMELKERVDKINCWLSVWKF